jgi:hypothetical protein
MWSWKAKIDGAKELNWVGCKMWSHNLFFLGVRGCTLSLHYVSKLGIYGVFFTHAIPYDKPKGAWIVSLTS